MSVDPVVTVPGCLAIVGLVLASALVSSSELASVPLAGHRIDALASGGDSSARSNLRRVLVTVLVGNDVAKIAAASIATALLVQVPPSGQAVTGATIFAGGVVPVLGEIAPKSSAVSNAEPWALRIARPLAVARRITSPFVTVFEAARNAVGRVAGGSSEFETLAGLTHANVDRLPGNGDRIESGPVVSTVLEASKTRLRRGRTERFDAGRGTEPDDL